jgi:hypothetical protein
MRSAGESAVRSDRVSDLEDLSRQRVGRAGVLTSHDTSQARDEIAAFRGPELDEVANRRNGQDRPADCRVNCLPQGGCQEQRRLGRKLGGEHGQGDAIDVPGHDPRLAPLRVQVGPCLVRRIGGRPDCGSMAEGRRRSISASNITRASTAEG